MSSDKSVVDYSLYLVTDYEMVPDGIDFFEQVEQALQNGVTIVQLREKKLDTGAFIDRGKKLHELTKKYAVPLIINDRVDVALAIGAEGVHVGQDDMDFVAVRELIGDDKILGVSCSSADEALEVVQKAAAKVDYIGIGAVYDTNTKALSSVPFGTQGVREVLKVLRDNNGKHIKSVLIGGLNKTNIGNVLYTSSIPGKSTDGVAVVSCIMAQRDVVIETKRTKAAIVTPGAWVRRAESTGPLEFLRALHKVQQSNPLVHHITNSVVKNFSANVTIAVGGSPIMSELSTEFHQLAVIPRSALVLNTGTPDSSQMAMYLEATKQYNLSGAPIVFDPVACGASDARREAAHKLLNHAYFSVIKGNAGEVFAAAGLESNMRGVDSDMADDQQAVLIAATRLAIAQRCVVVVTGKIDLIVDGCISPDSVSITQSLEDVSVRVAEISGGHELMGKITGSGCSLGSVIGTFIASAPGDIFEQTCAAVRLYKQAGALAGVRSSGPGTFMINFLDALYETGKSDTAELFDGTTVKSYKFSYR